MCGGESGDDQRGMSNLVGVVLLIGMTLVGALALVTVGGTALQSISDQTQSDVAQESFQELNSRLSGLADSSVDASTTFEFSEGVGRDVSLNTTGASIELAVTNESLADASGPDVCTTGEKPLGTVYYTDSENTVYAYQAGGVWERTGNSGRMVARPSLDYDGKVVDLTLVNVSRLKAINENREVVATKNVEASQEAARELDRTFRPCWTERSGDDAVTVNVTLTIESEFADAWADYARNDMRVAPDSVDYSESTNTVKMVFSNVGGSSSGSSGGSGPGSGTSDPIFYNGPVDGPSYTQYYDGESYQHKGSGTCGSSGVALPSSSILTGDRLCHSETQPGYLVPPNTTLYVHDGGDWVQREVSYVLASDVASSSRPDSSSVAYKHYEVDDPDRRICLVDDAYSDRPELRDDHCAPGRSGGSTDPAVEESGNALTVRQDEGELTLLGAEIGAPVEVERVVEDEEYRDPMDVTFVLDRSGSMDDNDPDGKRYDATKSFIDDLNATHGDRAGALQFNEDVYELHGLSSDLGAVKSSLVPRDNGGTDIGEGISAGNDQLDHRAPDRNKVMVLLSDGRNSDGSDFYAFLQARAARNNNVTIYTIGLGDRADEALLKHISEETNGSYYHVSNADDLESIFQEIQEDATTRTVRMIQRNTTEVTARHTNTEQVQIAGEENLNDPTLGSGTDRLNSLVSGTTLSFELEMESCSDWNLTSESETNATGATYRHAQCASSGGSTTTIDNSSVSNHVILTDGDSLREVDWDDGEDWWRTDPTAAIPSTHTSGNHADLDSNEAVIGLRVDDDPHKGYVLMHLEVPEMPPPPPRPSPSPPPSPGTTPDPGSSPTAPISIDFSEVVFS